MSFITKLLGVFLLANCIVLISCAYVPSATNPKIMPSQNPYYSRTDTNTLIVSDKEWKKYLSPEVYAISREANTEYAFSSPLWNDSSKGTYFCKACGRKLFRADAKFTSSCGWPSFYEQVDANSISLKPDNTHGMQRIEANCGRCGGHLGHLFDDGPAPTFKRYCMNGAVLDFEPDNITGLATSNNHDTIVLGGGCFWCTEAIYTQVAGVLSVQSGYSGGTLPNPTYEQVCSERTNHAEVIRIAYDTNQINLYDIFKIFFKVHDPTTLNRQGFDEGTSYRSVIFYKNKLQQDMAEKIIAELNNAKVYNNTIVTEVKPLDAFYPAEDYHQNYFENNKNASYCQRVIQPKVDAFNAIFKDKLKKK